MRSKPSLLERDGQLAQLARAVGGLDDGEGAAVLIEGPAGIGKTYLLDAAVADAGLAGGPSCAILDTFIGFVPLSVSTPARPRRALGASLSEAVRRSQPGRRPDLSARHVGATEPLP